MRPIKILVNAADVIDALSKAGPLTPAELAERVGIPRPSVYRMLDTLHAIGLTEPLPDSTAQLSRKWLHLADHARQSMREWHGARSALHELVERTGLTAFLTVRRGNEAVCIEWQQGRGIGVLVLKPGRTLPLYAGSEGRVLLAFDESAEEYIRTVERTAYTPETLVDERALREDLAVIGEAGYGVSDGDVTRGIGSIAVPVRHHAGRVAGALSVAGLAGEVKANRALIVADLLEAAGQLASSAG